MIKLIVNIRSSNNNQTCIAPVWADHALGRVYSASRWQAAW